MKSKYLYLILAFLLYLLPMVQMQAQSVNAYYDTDSENWVVSPEINKECLVFLCPGDTKIRVKTIIKDKDKKNANTRCKTQDLVLGINKSGDYKKFGPPYIPSSKMMTGGQLVKGLHLYPLYEWDEYIFCDWAEGYNGLGTTPYRFGTLKDDKDVHVDFTFELNEDWVNDTTKEYVTFVIFQNRTDKWWANCPVFGVHRLCKFTVYKGYNKPVLLEELNESKDLKIDPGESILLETIHKKDGWTDANIDSFDIEIDYSLEGTRYPEKDYEELGVPYYNFNIETERVGFFKIITGFSMDPPGYYGYEASEPGLYSYNVRLHERCGTPEMEKGSFEFELSYPCHNYILDGVTLKSSGESTNLGKILYEDTETGAWIKTNSLQVMPESTIRLDFSGEPSLDESKYNEYFKTNITGDGKSKIRKIGETEFVIPSDVKIARYTFSSAYRVDEYPAMEFCNSTAKTLSVTVGGADQHWFDSCLMVFPDKLFEYNSGVYVDRENYEWIFKTFKWKFESSRGVIFEDGMVLEDGAIVEIVNPHIIDEPLEGVDSDINFTQTINYDESGWIVSDTRSYYDDLGKPLQVQSKNLQHDVLMATQNIYDMYGRPTLQTLPAPMKAIHYKYDTRCKDRVQAGGNIEFGYDEEFVLDEYGDIYSYRNFDKSFIGDDPIDPVDNKIAGTLGWYYSKNNYIPAIKLDHIVLSMKQYGENVQARKSITMARGFETLRGDDVTYSLQTTMPLEDYELEAHTAISKIHEDNVPETKYPFSIAVYNEDGSEEVVANIPPGDYHQLGSGHEGDKRQQKIDGRDYDILEQYLYARAEALGIEFNDDDPLLNSLYKNIVTDANGKTSTTYHDNSGNELVVVLDGPPQAISYKIYNNKGNFVAEVSPNGVNDFNNNGKSWESIDKTTYTYNFRGHLLESESKEGGIVQFMYDRQGRLKYSQNEVQKTYSKYSYKNYDELGRVVESGVYQPVSSSMSFGNTGLKEIIDFTGEYLEENTMWRYGERSEVKYIVYDIPYGCSECCETEGSSSFINGKVSYTYTKDRATDADPKSMIVYNYDHLGRVKNTFQNNKEGVDVDINYTYNSSGNVSRIEYISGDQSFYHYYFYDRSLQLDEVYVSTNRYNSFQAKHMATKVANYEYYKHGPLKRAEIGTNLQGIDYVYNINGWLKAVNNTYAGAEAGSDGSNDMGVDIFAMNLEYFNGDYTSVNEIKSITNIPDAPEQFDGNIRAMEWTTAKPAGAYANGAIDEPVMYAYNYDNHGQLITAKFGLPEYTNGSMVNQGNKYAVNIGYGTDLNGNIQSIQRYDGSSALLDNFTYNYDGAKVNQLDNIPGYGSYAYNAIGQLTSDNISYNNVAFGQRSYTYNAPGKVTSIVTGEGILKYEYDVNGFRSKKIANGKETFYSRDMNGRLMAVYERNEGVTEWECVEIPFYGSERLGSVKEDRNDLDFTFEHKNHLGSVVNTYKPKDKYFGFKPVILGNAYLQYNGEIEIRETFTNINGGLEQTGTELGEVSSTLKSGAEFVGMAYVKDDGSVGVYEIYNTLKSSYEVSSNLGLVYFDLPERTVTANLIFDEDGLGTANNVSANFTHQHDEGILIQKVVSTLDSYNEVQAYVYSDGSGGVYIDGITGTVGNSSYNNVSFQLHDRKVSAMLFQDYYGSIRAEDIAHNFGTNDVTDGEYYVGLTASKEISGQVRNITTTLKVSGEYNNVSLYDMSIDNPLSVPQGEWMGRIALHFKDYEPSSNNIEVMSYTDYYPFGSPMADRRYVSGTPYRFGYQGEFAEDETDETGFNVFEARLYDAKIGRWTTTDAAKQHFSPYLAYSNNPIWRIDPDGLRDYALKGSATLTTGKLGLGILDGFGGWVAPFGANATGITIGFNYNDDSQFLSLDFEWKKTEIHDGSYSFSVGYGGGDQTIRENGYVGQIGFNFKKWEFDAKYKPIVEKIYKEESSVAYGSASYSETNGKNGKFSLGVSPSANLFFLGLELGAGFSTQGSPDASQVPATTETGPVQPVVKEP